MKIEELTILISLVTLKHKSLCVKGLFDIRSIRYMHAVETLLVFIVHFTVKNGIIS